jgi:hypothetical protein
MSEAAGRIRHLTFRTAKQLPAASGGEEKAKYALTRRIKSEILGRASRDG